MLEIPLKSVSIRNIETHPVGLNTSERYPTHNHQTSLCTILFGKLKSTIFSARSAEESDSSVFSLRTVRARLSAVHFHQGLPVRVLAIAAAIFQMSLARFRSVLALLRSGGEGVNKKKNTEEVDEHRWIEYLDSVTRSRLAGFYAGLIR